MYRCRVATCLRYQAECPGRACAVYQTVPQTRILSRDDTRLPGLRVAVSRRSAVITVMRGCSMSNVQATVPPGALFGDIVTQGFKAYFDQAGAWIRQTAIAGGIFAVGLLFCLF